MSDFIEHMLKPIYRKDSKVLILGTMPSPKSREFGFYYSHPQNRFWPVLTEILSEKLPTTNEEKESFLYRNRIALWDVLKSCEIVGAGDSTIKNPTVNDISLILKEADIKAVFTTGKKAKELYDKYCYKDTKMQAFYLPSSSAANCRNYNFESLAEAYRVILNYL